MPQYPTAASTPMGTFTPRQLEFTNCATWFAVSSANQYEVGRCDVTLGCTHDHLPQPQFSSCAVNKA